MNADANDDHDACQVHLNDFDANEENVASHHHHDHLCGRQCVLYGEVPDGRAGVDPRHGFHPDRFPSHSLSLSGSSTRPWLLPPAAVKIAPTAPELHQLHSERPSSRSPIGRSDCARPMAALGLPAAILECVPPDEKGTILCLECMGGLVATHNAQLISE